MILAHVSTINLTKAQWWQVQRMVQHSAVMSMQCLFTYDWQLAQFKMGGQLPGDGGTSHPESTQGSG